MNQHRIRLLPGLVLAAIAVPALADDDSAPEWYGIHGQATFTEQFHPAFRSPFRGANSLDPGNRGNETFDATLFAGLRLAPCLEAYADPEIDQGFGLSDTLGIAGFPSAEAYKVGIRHFYFQGTASGDMPRYFLRATIGLGGGETKVESGPNQLAGSRPVDSITVTVGKFAVPDIFDTNTYAHDPRSDFLNWAVVDSGAFDYAADAWGYTYGGAVDWTQSWWSLRGGVFALSRVPNSTKLDRDFAQFQLVAEAEERHDIGGNPGKVKLLGFVSRGRMANYADAVRLGEETGTTPNVALVRQFSSRPGGALNIEQQLATDLGAFLRASLNDGHKETFEFSDINRSLAAGLSLKGERWDRPNDTLGLAGVVNDISRDAKAYFAAGGLGVLIGDGQLPKSGPEKILELYYKLYLVDWLNLTFDYQLVGDPAYDAARGPVEIFGGRLHAEF
jgi:high affinity Mn2+ porin